MSILPVSIVTELFTDVSLRPKRKLRDYGGNPIAVKGCLRANVAFGGCSTNKDIHCTPRVCSVRQGLILCTTNASDRWSGHSSFQYLV